MEFGLFLDGKEQGDGRTGFRGRNPLKCLELPPPKVHSFLCGGNTKGRGNPGLLDLHLTVKGLSLVRGCDRFHATMMG